MQRASYVDPRLDRIRTFSDQCALWERTLRGPSPERSPRPSRCSTPAVPAPAPRYERSTSRGLSPGHAPFNRPSSRSARSPPPGRLILKARKQRPTGVLPAAETDEAGDLVEAALAKSQLLLMHRDASESGPAEADTMDEAEDLLEAALAKSRRLLMQMSLHLQGEDEESQRTPPSTPPLTPKRECGVQRAFSINSDIGALSCCSTTCSLDCSHPPPFSSYPSLGSQTPILESRVNSKASSCGGDSISSCSTTCSSLYRSPPTFPGYTGPLLQLTKQRRRTVASPSNNSGTANASKIDTRRDFLAACDDALGPEGAVVTSGLSC